MQLESHTEGEPASCISQLLESMDVVGYNMHRHWISTCLGFELKCRPCCGCGSYVKTVAVIWRGIQSGHGQCFSYFSYELRSRKGEPSSSMNSGPGELLNKTALQIRKGGYGSCLMF